MRKREPRMVKTMAVPMVRPSGEKRCRRLVAQPASVKEEASKIQTSRAGLRGNMGKGKRGEERMASLWLRLG